MDAPARRLALLLLLLLLLLALLPAAALAAIVGASQHDSAQQQSWARGGYGLLTVAEDASMTFTFGNLTLHGAAPTGASGSTSPGAAGVDPQLGSFDELLLPAGAGGGFAIRYFSKLDAFTFERRPSNDSEAAALLDTTFPRFDGQPFEANSTDKALCMGWSNHYFFPGGVTSLNDCQTDGPLFLFEPLANGSTTTAAALALTPLLNFTLASVSPQLLGVTAKRPAQGSVALLLARPGFVRANRAVGSVLRQAHATTRLRGIGTSGLSYCKSHTYPPIVLSSHSSLAACLPRNALGNNNLGSVEYSSRVVGGRVEPDLTRSISKQLCLLFKIEQGAITKPGTPGGPSDRTRWCGVSQSRSTPPSRKAMTLRKFQSPTGNLTTTSL